MNRLSMGPDDGENNLPELVIRDTLGVCGVRDDTRAVAQAAATQQPAGRALDLGTGSGYIGLYLAQRGWEVDAVDISPGAVELARRNATLNKLTMSVFQSDLFGQVSDTYDLIVFNPPMRPDESEFTRTVTSVLRRSEFISALLMNSVGRFLEQSRFDFLSQVLRDARRHLKPGGRVLMGISEDEAQQLSSLPEIRQLAIMPIPTMPRQEVVEFQFWETPIHE